MLYLLLIVDLALVLMLAPWFALLAAVVLAALIHRLGGESGLIRAGSPRRGFSSSSRRTTRPG